MMSPTIEQDKDQTPSKRLSKAELMELLSKFEPWELHAIYAFLDVFAWPKPPSENFDVLADR